MFQLTDITGDYNKREYQCTSDSDIANLPTSTAVGTGGVDDKSNEKCGVGSTALVANGSVTKVYILAPTDTWEEM